MDALRALEAVAQSANDAIITADAASRVLSWNRGAERMFGWTAEEMVGAPLSRIIPERHRDAHARGMARVRGGGTPHVIGAPPVELHALTREGREVPIELTLARWSDGDEELYTGILRDITERKRAEEQLRAFAAKLEASEQRAIAASRAKSTFLASMSHELRTPLNAILGFVQLLDRDPRLAPDQRKSLSIIMQSGEHLLALINDVLSISKIEAGQATLSEVPFDLGRLARGLEETFRARARMKGLELGAELDVPLPTSVLGDEAKIRQVLLNLLSNAVKFTATGRVTLRVRWVAGLARFEVEDTGPGMSDDELEALFQPFTQTTAGIRAAEGSGLGLVISRSFVHLMGGELSVDSAVGRGSRFAFVVPLPETDRAPWARVDRRVVGIERAGRPPKVLVVENDDHSRTLLVRLLTDVGFDVREAVDGREALDVWESFAPSFVWMDMRMPVLDGYAATRELRRREAERDHTPRTVVVALTASAFEDDRPKILDAGCNDIVSKPFREDDLFELLAEHLDLRYVHGPRAPGASPPRPAEPPAGDLATQLALLPRETLERLARQLTEGDDQAALATLEGVRARDAATVDAIAGLVRELRLDLVLGLLERNLR
ncbi:PAS domain S-box protein [Myxococcota bacterium]|nr:PAS domain S-box protein [Myxococcota bacterium]